MQNKDLDESRHFESRFPFLVRLLRIGGVPIKTRKGSRFYFIYEIVSILSLYSVLVSAVMELIVNVEDFEGVVNSLRILLTLALLICCQSSLRLRRSTLEHLMSLVEAYTWEDLPKTDPETGEVTMAGWIPIIQVIAKRVLFTACFFHAVQTSLRIFISRDVIFRGWYPFDPFVSPVYEILFVFQVIGSACMMCIFFGFLGLYATLVAIACSQLEKLKSVLMDARMRIIILGYSNGNGNNSVKIEIWLKDCIIRHQSILEYNRELEETMNLTFCGLLLILLVTLCFSSFCIITAWNNPADASQAVATYFLMLGNAFVICWFGNELTEQTESVRDAAWSSDWVGAPTAIQRCILHMIATANKEFTLTAGKFVPVSNATLMNMINQSVSLFMFLLQVKHRNEETTDIQ